MTSNNYFIVSHDSVHGLSDSWLHLILAAVGASAGLDGTFKRVHSPAWYLGGVDQEAGFS